ncbi:2'-5' RNA ligase family protein [Sandarakinorhabdus glacialis]|uniref:2'-5' RNA ligase family protein n=1 Tax=Sandarakinorhabdus glacialis TaxID=1614636 RepID=UPI00166F5FBD|nr:2'-5' RNA ligase family protein [Polymorphobacter glacialis]
MNDARPLILTALFEAPVQARFETLRREFYPAEINRVPAHVSLFHHLPGSELEAVKRRLKAVCGPLPRPAVAVTGLKSLGGGVAFKLRSAELDDVRAELAAGWDTLLIPQDRAGFRAHVTVQNKVTSATARATLQGLEAGFVPFEAEVVAVAIWRYLGGPWEALGQVAFRGR